MKQRSVAVSLRGNDCKSVAYLRVPPIGEEEQVGTVEEDVKRWRRDSAGGFLGYRTALCSPRRLGVRNSALTHSDKPIAIYETDYWRWAGVSKALGFRCIVVDALA